MSLRGFYECVKLWWILPAYGNGLSIYAPAHTGQCVSPAVTATVSDPAACFLLTLWQERDQDQRSGALTCLHPHQHWRWDQYALTCGRSVLINFNFEIACVLLSSACLGCFDKDSRLIYLKLVLSVLAIRDFWFSVTLCLEQLCRHPNCPYRRRWWRYERCKIQVHSLLFRK